MKVYTIFYKGNDARYGYESSQISRQRVFDELGIPHTVLLGLPLPYPNWQERLAQIGYTQYISICNAYSDIAQDALSVTFEAYKKDKTIDVIESQEQYVKVLESGKEKTIYITKEQTISHVEDDQSIAFYTSGVYLTKDKTTNHLHWYNQDGSLALFSVPGIQADYIFYNQDNQLLGNTDTLMKDFLIKHLKQDDVIIYDPLFTIAGDLKRYLRAKRIKTYQVIHYNVLDPAFSHVIPDLKSWLTYIAASEKMVEPLKIGGLDITFIPPMHVETVSVKKTYASVMQFCLVGAYSFIKRIDMAVQAFSELEKQNVPVQLTIYGGDDSDIADFKTSHVIPNNVRFVRRVDKVPYEQYDAYISCSQSECFANALVEASGHGLVILASDVDLAHRHYATVSKDMIVFETDADLVQCIKDLQRNGGIAATEIAEQYTLEKVKQHYRAVFGKED